MSYRRWNRQRRWKNYNRPNRGKGSKSSAKANASKPGAYKVPYRPERNKVYQSKEARRFRKHTPEYMMNRRVPPTKRPPKLPLGSSVLPEYAALNTNLLKLGQQHLPFGMKPRTIDGPDHY